MKEQNLPSARQIAKMTNESGYFHIPAAYYYKDEHCAELLHLQQYYFGLPEDIDPLGGRKFRSRASYTLRDGQISQDAHCDYIQHKNDNKEQKGKGRQFAPTSPDVLNMKLFSHLVKADLEIAQEMKKVDFTQEVEIGVHAIRYAPLPNDPSYSSPRWLHKDTEETVFVHLINLSGNAVGGENVISQSAKFNGKFDIIRLGNPLESLLVNRKYFHAVVPLSVGAGSFAYRDVLLITFNNRKPNNNQNAA